MKSFKQFNSRPKSIFDFHPLYKRGSEEFKDALNNIVELNCSTLEESIEIVSKEFGVPESQLFEFFNQPIHELKEIKTTDKKSFLKSFAQWNLLNEGKKTTKEKVKDFLKEKNKDSKWIEEFIFNLTEQELKGLQ